MRTTAIVAYDPNRVIGKDNSLPNWHLPEDIKHFKNTTEYNIVIMGKNTFKSIPKKYAPLKNRYNIVISSKWEDSMIINNEIMHCVSSIEEAIRSAKLISNMLIHSFGDDKLECFVIGGESVYKQFLEKDLIDRVIASEVKGIYEGNKYFPKLNNDWTREVVQRNKEFDIVEYKFFRKVCDKLQV